MTSPFSKKRDINFVAAVCAKPQSLIDVIYVRSLGPIL